MINYFRRSAEWRVARLAPDRQTDRQGEPKPDCPLNTTMTTTTNTTNTTKRKRGQEESVELDIRERQICAQSFGLVASVGVWFWFGELWGESHSGPRKTTTTTTQNPSLDQGGDFSKARRSWYANFWPLTQRPCAVPAMALLPGSHQQSSGI